MSRLPTREAAAWQSITTTISTKRLPGNGLMVVLDSDTGELDHVQVRVRTVGELARWIVHLEARPTRHEREGMEWQDVYGDVGGFLVHVSTAHTEVES